MDRQALRLTVFEKTGIKVDTDDPIFALVALNEAVLAETVERQVARLDAAATSLAEQALRGGHPAHHTGVPSAGAPSAGLTPAGLPPAGAPSAGAFSAPAVPAGPGIKPIATQAPLLSPREARLLAAAAGIALLCALLVLAGQALFFAHPAALTQQQAEAIRQGEKLARAVEKLDPKSRAAIAAEMQKP